MPSPSPLGPPSRLSRLIPSASCQDTERSFISSKSLKVRHPCRLRFQGFTLLRSTRPSRLPGHFVPTSPTVPVSSRTSSSPRNPSPTTYRRPDRPRGPRPSPSPRGLSRTRDSSPGESGDYDYCRTTSPPQDLRVDSRVPTVPGSTQATTRGLRENPRRRG